MKKIIIMIAIMAMLIGIDSCKKGLTDKQAQTNAALMTKFYATTQKTKPATKRLIEYIKNNDKLGNLDAFVKKYGFPIWDKAIVKPQSNFAARGENEDDFIVVPTILEDDYKVNGFIAAETNEILIQLKSFLDTDYKQFPYKSTTALGFTAEDFVGILMELGQEVYDRDRFKIMDPLLSFAITNTTNDDIRLHIGGGIAPLQKGIFYSDPLPRDGCTYTCQGQEDENGNWVQITPWVLLHCPQNTINELLEAPFGGGGGGGGSSGNSNNPPNNPIDKPEWIDVQKLHRRWIVESVFFSQNGNSSYTVACWTDFYGKKNLKTPVLSHFVNAKGYPSKLYDFINFSNNAVGTWNEFYNSCNVIAGGNLVEAHVTGSLIETTNVTIGIDKNIGWLFSDIF